MKHKSSRNNKNRRNGDEKVKENGERKREGEISYSIKINKK